MMTTCAGIRAMRQVMISTPATPRMIEARTLREITRWRSASAGPRLDDASSPWRCRCLDDLYRPRCVIVRSKSKDRRIAASNHLGNKKMNVDSLISQGAGHRMQQSRTIFAGDEQLGRPRLRETALPSSIHRSGSAHRKNLDGCHIADVLAHDDLQIRARVRQWP